MTYRKTSQHPTPAAVEIPMTQREMEMHMEQIGRYFESRMEQMEARAAEDGVLEPMEAARLIAAEMAANAIQREIATPCEPTDERARLLRDWRIATRCRAEAHDRMTLAAREYRYTDFETARDERDCHQRTASLLRSKLRDQFGITRPDLQTGGAL